VAADEPLVELETDKVTVEVTAPAAGVLTAINYPEGSEVEVGALLGMLDGDGSGEAPRAGAAAARVPAAGSASADRGARATATQATATAGAAPSQPTAARMASQVREVPTEPTAPTRAAPADVSASEVSAAPGEPITRGRDAAPVSREATAPAEADPATRAAANPPAGINPPPRPLGPVARPAVRDAVQPTPHDPFPAAVRLMEEQKLAPSEIGAGSGKDGRITKGDVLAFLNRPAPAVPAARPAARQSRPEDPREQRVKMTRLRRTIAARLKEAQNTAAMLTTFNEVDMSAVMALRAEYRDAFEKKHNGTRLGFMSVFVRACCVALKEFPAVNAEIDGDDIIYKNYVNMGIAVGGPSGLVVPVIRDADRLGFAGIEAAIADFGKRARDGQLKLDDLTGGTFSITNGGIYGSLMSTPILNPPQSAILGMHKIQERAMVVGGKIEVRPMMYLAVSYDHRIVDGKEAVSFLVRVKEGVEDPRRLLLEI
jgi:2-oxoglutarate dehydrogenase E2 component (dihydrolipoamide succinyltransferase)